MSSPIFSDDYRKIIKSKDAEINRLHEVIKGRQNRDDAMQLVIKERDAEIARLETNYAILEGQAEKAAFDRDDARRERDALKTENKLLQYNKNKVVTHLKRIVPLYRARLSPHEEREIQREFRELIELEKPSGEKK